ncbi:hypothetical protein ACFQVA_34200 [Actinomadura keratinilytica]
MEGPGPGRGPGGEWLDWHRRTVMLDALEQLHAQGRALAGKGRG